MIDMHFILRPLEALIRTMSVTPAFADWQTAISTVGGSMGGGGGGNIGDMFESVMVAFVVLSNVIGMIMITKAGVTLAAKQGDDSIGAAKKTIGATAVALILINLAPTLKAALSTLGSGGGGMITVELLGIANFIDAIAGAAALVAIIVSGIRAVTSYGGEDGTTHLKRAVFAVVAGVIIIGAKMAIAGSVETGSPTAFLNIVVNVANVILGFGALLAVTAIIYAGMLMVVNFGKEDQYAKAKNLIIRVCIGLMVILCSAAIVNIVIGS